MTLYNLYVILQAIVVLILIILFALKSWGITQEPTKFCIPIPP